MLKGWVAVLLSISILMISHVASAHIMNNNTYDDIENPSAAKDIVTLTVLNIVRTEDNLIKPQEILTMQQLAIWLARFHGLKAASDRELAQAALEVGYIETLVGNATYAAVNTSFFNDKLELQDSHAMMTHEQFAGFMAQYISEDIIAQANLKQGSSGTIEAVNEGKHDKVEIEGQQYELSAHPYVIANYVNPTVWIGENVAESYLATAYQDGISTKSFRFIRNCDQRIADEDSAENISESMVEREKEKRSTSIVYLYLIFGLIFAAFLCFILFKKNK